MLPLVADGVKDDPLDQLTVLLGKPHISSEPAEKLFTLDLVVGSSWLVHRVVEPETKVEEQREAHLLLC